MSGASCDHGHVFRRQDGTRARCGGPGFCRDCDGDLAVLAAREGRHPDVVEAELQACFDRARQAT